MKEKSNKLKISLTIDEHVYNRFRLHCVKNGYKLSTRVSVLIQKDLIEGLPFTN